MCVSVCACFRVLMSMCVCKYICDVAVSECFLQMYLCLLVIVCLNTCVYFSECVCMFEHVFTLIFHLKTDSTNQVSSFLIHEVS